MEINPRGLDLIKEFEGCSLVAYRDLRGILTIGYGCTHNVTDGLAITQEQANARLQQDVDLTVKVLSGLVPRTLNSNQFSALVCLAYNIGLGNFAQSTLLKKLLEGDITGASEEFLRWDKINGNPVPGLLRRRGSELDLFLDPAKQRVQTEV